MAAVGTKDHRSKDRTSRSTEQGSTRSLPNRSRPDRSRGEGPLRRCIVSGERRPQEELLRFVVGPDQTLVPDLGASLPGRGLWLSPRRDMLDKACDRNLFAKAAKSAVKVPSDLVPQVEGLLKKRCLERIGLAKRAGQLVAGHDQVKAWLAAGKAGALVQAADASEDGRAKLRALARAVAPGLPVVELFTAEELGTALGRTPVVHVAVAPGGFAERIVAEAKRLSGFGPHGAEERDERQSEARTSGGAGSRIADPGAGDVQKVSAGKR